MESGNVELLTPDEACAMLRLSKSTLYRLSSNRDIPKTKLHGKLLFRRHDLESWIEANSTTPVR